MRSEVAFDCDPLQVSVKGLLRHEMGRGGMGRGGVGSGGWGWFGGVGWDRVVWGVGGVGGGLDWVGWGGVTPPVHTSCSHFLVARTPSAVRFCPSSAFDPKPSSPPHAYCTLHSFRRINARVARPIVHRRAGSCAHRPRHRGLGRRVAWGGGAT